MYTALCGCLQQDGKPLSHDDFMPDFLTTTGIRHHAKLYQEAPVQQAIESGTFQMALLRFTGCSVKTNAAHGSTKAEAG
jgi:hypothetical protein